LNLWLLFGLVAGLTAVTIIAIAFLIPRPKCGKCGADLPVVRTPKNARQAMLGGCTCPKCGAELDRTGTPLPPE
jgi:hypothetical protein